MSWLKRLKFGLTKSSDKLASGIGSIFTKRRLDQEMLDELEELLIMADLGSETAKQIVNNFSKSKFDKEVNEKEVREALALEIAKILNLVTKPLVINDTLKPQVIIMVGVNGNGKTTTLGKLAKQFKRDGKSVIIAACDTFRAAAVEQLSVWGKKSGCHVVTGTEGIDPASVAYRAFEEAKNQGVDVLLIDTAGRLQNKKGLMEELAKISRVLKKIDNTAPHETLLVLDATTGQNAHSQAESFKLIADISGIIVTKLDGTAKGGVIVALADKFNIPMVAIGVGEGIDDLHHFDAISFSRGLMGLNISTE